MAIHNLLVQAFPKLAPTEFRRLFDLLVMLRMVFQHAFTGGYNSKVGFFLFFSSLKLCIWHYVAIHSLLVQEFPKPALTEFCSSFQSVGDATYGVSTCVHLRA